MLLSKKKTSSSTLDKEKVLIEKAKKDPAAFKPLYDFYYESIFRFVYAKLADEAEAADICSTVFLKALLNLPGYESRGYPFGSWLYKIACNEVLQYFRKNQKQRNVLVSKEFLSGLYPEDEEGKQNLIDQLEGAIQELNYEEVQLIELKFWEKKAYAEIAYIMDISVPSAKTRMSRIYRKLEMKLKRYLP